MTHMDNLKNYREMPRTVRLTGGAARSDTWVQIFADCFQSTVEIPDGTELGALGAAIAAGVAAGCFPDYHKAIESMVRFSKTVTPNAEARDIYQQKYHNYRKIIDILSSAWNFF
jgi:L-xylulokinase